jgi:hypothetical protein
MRSCCSFAYPEVRLLAHAYNKNRDNNAGKSSVVYAYHRVVLFCLCVPLSQVREDACGRDHVSSRHPPQQGSEGLPRQAARSHRDPGQSQVPLRPGGVRADAAAGDQVPGTTSTVTGAHGSAFCDCGHPAREPVLSLPLSDGHCTNWSPLERCLFVFGVLRPALMRVVFGILVVGYKPHIHDGKGILSHPRGKCEAGCLCACAWSCATRRAIACTQHAGTTSSAPRRSGSSGRRPQSSRPRSGRRTPRRCTPIASGEQTMPARTPTTLTHLRSHALLTGVLQLALPHPAS